MSGSRIAKEIIEEQQREKAFKKKAIRMQCIVDKNKQCNECKYKDICEEKD